MLCTLLPCLCGSLFIDCCGALIRLKHTGLRSYLGVITGLGEESRGFPPPPWSHPLKSKIMWSREGRRWRRRQRGAGGEIADMWLIYLQHHSVPSHYVPAMKEGVAIMSPTLSHHAITFQDEKKSRLSWISSARTVIFAF